MRKKTLILGDIGTGKTRLTAQIIKELLKNGYRNDITIIDLAPIQPSNCGRKVGGRITDYINIDQVRYLTSNSITAPRSTARSRDELVVMIVKNKQLIDPLLNKYLESPTKILTINDLTMYLHAGKLDKMEECILKSESFIGNAYYGTFFKNDLGTGVSARERKLTDKLCRIMDKTIRP
ncbi:MAG: hypothetical protein ACFE7E_00945 [Candidatus Hodarchaeota archaeon]